MADTARTERWDYLEFMAKVLSEEVAARETHGGENRVKAARFPQTKTLDDFDFTHQRSVSRSQVAHLHQLDFLREAKNVIFLGPPGTSAPSHRRSLTWLPRPHPSSSGRR